MEESNNNLNISSKKDKIIGKIFLIWFILSVLSFIITGKLEMNHLCVFIFGQYFLVFSCIALFHSKEMPLIEKIIIFISYIAGLGCIIGSIISKNYERLKIITSDFSYKYHIYFIITIIVLILSFIFLLLHCITKKKNNKYYYLFLTLLIIFILLALYLCI